MDPLRTYEYLAIARRKIFEWVRPLTEAQYATDFAIGLGSLARTLTHIMICEWAYVRRIQRLDLPPYESWPMQDERPPPFAVVESVWNEQAAQTRTALAAVHDWDDEVEYRVTWTQRPTIVTASIADIFTQLLLHEVHHRAQAMYMLRRLGVAAEGLDFNTLMYRRREAATPSA